MWCKHCRQDVPAVPVSSGKRVCMRCGTAADDGFAAHTVGVAKLAAHGVNLEATDKPAPRKPPVDLDEWDLEQDFRHVQNLAALAAQNNASQLAASRAAQSNSLPGSLTMPSLSLPTTSVLPTQARRKPPRASSQLAWLSLSLGLMAFVCGVVLMVWSFAEGRGALWSLGMPITVVGQAALLVGLVLQLERIGQGNRYTADQLEHVDAQLSSLQQSTHLLGITHGSAAQAFYAHMAEGASPNLLLADLKGQLDLLAVRMAQR